MDGKELNLKKYIWIAIIIVLVLWGLNWIMLLIPDASFERGTFGDMFGTVNALFSGLAFAGIIITILLQRRELELQREEMKLQRKELEDTRAEFEMQNQTMKLQRFENTFFQMVDLHNKIVSAILYELSDLEKQELYRNRDKYELYGRDALNYYRHLLAEHIRLNDIGSFSENYEKFYSKYKAVLGHYFRNLYRMVKFVHDFDITTEGATTEEEFNLKYQYTSIIRAQLSEDEKILLYYSCYSNYGRKFKPLIERYSLLKGLKYKELHLSEIGSYYDKKAFIKPRNYAENYD